MDKKTAKELAKTMYAAFNDRDFDRFLEHTVADVQMSTPALGYEATGHDALLGFLQGWVSMSSDLRVHLEECYVDGEHLVNCISGRGTHDGHFETPWGALAPTGRSFTGTATEHWDVRNGMVVAVRSEVDLTTLLTQLGHAPGRFDLEPRVREFYDLVNRGAISEVERLISPSFINHEHLPGMSAGRDGVADFLELMRSAFPDFRMTVDDVIAAGDTAVVRLRMSGTHKGEFLDVPATNRSFEVETIDIVRFDGELAIEHWGVTDTMAMFDKLGIVELPTPTIP